MCGRWLRRSCARFDEAAGVHVYRGHASGGLDNQVAAGAGVDVRGCRARLISCSTLWVSNSGRSPLNSSILPNAPDVLLGETGHAAVVSVESTRIFRVKEG